MHSRVPDGRETSQAGSSGGKSGGPGGTRTPGLLVRSQSLYPAELRARDLPSIAKAVGYTGPSHMSRESGRETEVKLRIADAAQGEALLRAAGFALLHPREHEDNVVLDTQDISLRRTGRLLRLRSARQRTILTYKGPALPGKHKEREEIETDVADYSGFLRILENLGYTVSFRYEKFRSEYARPDDPGIATLDETPIGTFIELEGPSAWIDETAAMLGFRESDYITASYGSLYLQFRERTGSTSRDMVFQ